jgi:two-component system OmpR family response regulator
MTAADTDPKKPRTILVVDDDPHISDVVGYALSSAGFRVVKAFDGEEAVSMVESSDPDLLVLDINLPGKDGMWVCRRIREFSSVPIIFLTARDEELDRVVGLVIGADDYVTKPFSPRELAARVEAVLRRPRATLATPAPPSSKTGTSDPASTPAQGSGSAGTGRDGRIAIGSLMLDTEGFEAFWDGSPVELTATEFKLLAALARRPGKVFSRDELLKLVSPDVTVNDRTVDSHILHIRKKFQKAGGEVVQTRHGVGYSLAQPGKPSGEG